MRAPAVALFLLVSGAYAYFYQAGGWNQNCRLDLTRAIVERHVLNIDAYQQNTGDKARVGGHYYCDKAPGASWLAVPPVALAYALMGPHNPEPASPRYLATASYLAVIWAVGIPSAIAVVLMWKLLELFGLDRWARLGAAVAWGLATLAFPYATLLYGHQLAAALLLSAFALFEGMRAAKREPRPGLLLGIGLLLGAAVTVEYPAAAASAVICVYGMWILKSFRRMLWIFAGGLFPAIALAAYNGICFGSPFASSYAFSVGYLGMRMPNLYALAGLLVSSHRGIFHSMPWLSLSLPGALILWRRGVRGPVIVCAAIVVFSVTLNMSMLDWEGGWAMGARHLITALPFLAILAAGVLAPSSAAGVSSRTRSVLLAMFASAATFAFGLMLVGTAVKPEVPYATLRPFGEFLLPAFSRGALSVNTQSIDSGDPDENGPRAAWNLGQVIGLDGLSSLLPLMIWLGACSTWLVMSKETRGHAISQPGLFRYRRASHELRDL